MDTGSKVAITGAASWAQCTLATADGAPRCVIEIRGEDAWLTLAPLGADRVVPSSPSTGSRPPAALVLLPSGGLLRFDTDTAVLRRYEPAGPDRREPPWTAAFEAAPAVPPGSFGPEAEHRPAANYPAAALDPEGVLSLVDGIDGALLILDLVDRTVLGRVRLDAPALDVALDPAPDASCSLIVLVDDPERPLRRVDPDGRTRSLAYSRPAGLPETARPRRVGTGTAATWVLWTVPGAAGDPPTGIATQASGPRRDRLVLPGVLGATEIEIAGEGAVVLGRGPGADLARFLPAQVRTALAARQIPGPEWLRAPGYDGHGLLRTPAGRVAFWTARGLRHAFASPVNRSPAGFAISYPLDGGSYHQRWGRIFVDACLPAGTGLRVAAVTGDEPYPPPTPDDFPPAGPLVPRGTGDTPWLDRTEAGLVTYETVVHAPAGRFLWLRLDLTGTPTAQPEVLAVRVERPSVHLIDKLPAVYSAEPASADFLDRYLALLSGPLRDLEVAAADRAVLLDPETTPSDLLPWLAGLVGLSLDDRWPLAARRRLTSQAVPLFRRRGTIAALADMIELLLGVRPTVVEQYQYRGLDGQGGVGDGYAEHAHRFTVVLPLELGDDQQGALQDLLEVHRPAHTLVRVCTLRSARVGLGLHLGISAMISAGEAYTSFTVGHALDGRSLLGRRRRGIRPGTSTVGDREGLVLR